MKCKYELLESAATHTLLKAYKHLYNTLFIIVQQSLKDKHKQSQLERGLFPVTSVNEHVQQATQSLIKIKIIKSCCRQGCGSGGQLANG